MKKHIVFLAFLLLFVAMNATLLFEDNFTGTPGTLLTANGWVNHSGSSNYIPISSTNLTYTGYQSSSGGSASLLTTGEDVHVNFPAQTSGSIYASCLVNVTSSQTTGDYLFHFGVNPWGSFPGRLFLKKSTTSTNFAFGISRTASTATSYTGFNYAINTTYLVVMKYTIVSGIKNDEVKLFINPAFGLESTADLTISTADTGDDPANIGGIALRQGGATSAPVALVDGIRVGTTWADVAGGTLSAPTTQTTNVAFANVAQTQMDVSCTVGDGAKRLIIMNTTNSFTDPTNGTDPSVNTLYSGSGEQVIYNGAGNSVTVTGLTAGNTYWFRAYEYNGTGTGTLYLSSAAAGNPNSQITATSVVIPTVTTSAISAITINSATSGGEVTSDGGGTVTVRGICWNTTGSPTINDDYTEDGTGLGVFSSSLTLLAEHQTYYVRAYATNSAGEGYGNELTFTTLKSEPTNHATGFTAANGASPDLQILVSWTDATGSVIPDGYLVKGSAVGYSSIVDPTDATAEANGTLVRNVTSGTQSYTFTGLTSNTTYYFKIYSYTNSGTSIDYKVDGIVPTASHTTTAGPALTELIVPQYIQGVNGTNNQRVAYATRLTLSNLLPNTTYRYTEHFVNTSDGLTGTGAGIAIYVGADGTFTRSTTTSLGTAGQYGEFTTDATGSYTGWFMGEPSANARFTPGSILYYRLRLNNGAGGTTGVYYLTTSSSIKVINFGPLDDVNQGTFLHGLSAAPAKNFAFVYDNVAGSGRPIAGNVIESDGIDLSGVTQILPAYKTSVDNVNGAWGVIIPNSVGAKGFTGIQRVEARVFETGAVYAANTDADGVWGGVNTVNPTGGDTSPLDLTGEATLPLELSSFTAVISSQNFVNLMWTTQSETGVSGFYIYRGTIEDASQAELISPMISATNTSVTHTYLYTDNQLYNDGVYYYWLQNVDFDGTNSFHGPVVVNYSTGTDGPGTPVIPEVTELKGIFPNPFNPTAQISYSLKDAASVSIKVYNSRGQIVRSFENAPGTVGNHRIVWDGRDFNGSSCSTGVYFVRMFAGKEVFTQKAVLVK